jgi:hypothetical protein
MTAYRAALYVGAAVSAAAVLASTPAHAAPRPYIPDPPQISHKVAPRSGPIPDADKAFMALVRAIPGTTILDPAIVEAGGRNVCSQYLEAGRTRADTIAAFIALNQTFTPSQAAAFVEAAADAYCPREATQRIA